MREKGGLRIKQDSYENQNNVCGHELCHLVRMACLTTGFSLRRMSVKLL